jgi:hypothetical protein
MSKIAVRITSQEEWDNVLKIIGNPLKKSSQTYLDNKNNSGLCLGIEGSHKGNSGTDTLGFKKYEKITYHQFIMQNQEKQIIYPLIFN